MSAEKIYDEPLGSSGRSPQKSFLGRYGPASYIYIYILYILNVRGGACVSACARMRVCYGVAEGVSNRGLQGMIWARWTLTPPSG